MAWATLKAHLSEWCFACVLYSYANPSLIASCERPKIHVSHCNMPQGYTAWQIKSVSLTLAAWRMCLSSFWLYPVEGMGLMGSCLMSCAHFLSVCLLLELLGIYLRDNRLKQTDLTDWKLPAGLYKRCTDNVQWFNSVFNQLKEII